MKKWEDLGDMSRLDSDTAYDLAVYDKGSYDSPEAAEAVGGLYAVPSSMFGREQVYDCVDGVIAAGQCMDSNNGLVIVIREAT